MNFPHRSTFGSDELFLSKYIYPQIKNKGLETYYTNSPKLKIIPEFYNKINTRKDVRF